MLGSEQLNWYDCKRWMFSGSRPQTNAKRQTVRCSSNFVFSIVYLNIAALEHEFRCLMQAVWLQGCGGAPESLYNLYYLSKRCYAGRIIIVWFWFDFENSTTTIDLDKTFTVIKASWHPVHSFSFWISRPLLNFFQLIKVVCGGIFNYFLVSIYRCGYVAYTKIELFSFKSNFYGRE